MHFLGTQKPWDKRIDRPPLVTRPTHPTLVPYYDEWDRLFELGKVRFSQLRTRHSSQPGVADGSPDRLQSLSLRES